MDHPSQLFRRIRRFRARPDLPRRAPEVPAPAPIRIPDAPAPAPIRAPEAPPPEAAPAAPPRGHALYSQVMRSHDRMGTRHL